MNPSTLLDPLTPSATFTLDSGVANLSSLLIRTANLDNGDAYVIDELRIANACALVVPEPGGVALVAGGALVFAMRRRGRCLA